MKRPVRDVDLLVSMSKRITHLLFPLLPAAYLIFGPVASVCAQTFALVPTQVEISVAPTFDHMPLRLAVTSTAPGFSIANLQVSSDSTWVIPSIDVAKQEIVLTFKTANLISQSYTATITAKLGSEAIYAFVKANIAPLNIFRLKDDPLRSRTYGIQQNGLQTGSVVVLDPITETHIGNITVGKKPCDLAETRDGLELLVINSVDQSITVIDLTTLALKETIPLPVFGNWGPDSTTANVGIGPGDIIYYTDGSWAPALMVMNRKTRTVLQTNHIDGTSGNGFGDFALSSDYSQMIAWMQYGWSAGLANSYISRFKVGTDGLLTFVEAGDSMYTTTFQRDPLETPVLLSSDNKVAFIKGLAVDASSIRNVLHQFPGPVYAITPGGEIAVTDKAIYESETGIKLADLPKSVPVQTISSDYSRLIYYDSGVRELKTLNLLDLVGPQILKRQITPANGSITLSPERLEWPTLPGVDRFQVYLGQSVTDVANADKSSPLYQGEVASPFFYLGGSLAPGTTFYWRVDAVTEFETVKGDVFNFTVSTISSSVSEIDVATVHGHKDFRTSFQIASAGAQSWQAFTDKPWVTVPVSTGVTPSTVELRLDASGLAAGSYHAYVTISNGSMNLFAIPITLKVEPLSLTILKSDLTSSFVYGISEDTSSMVSSRAYLLEISTATESIERVVPVGSSVTDMAVHHGDNRIYVTNWRSGSLLAIDLSTFGQVRSYGFAPFGGTGYSQGDVYRVSAGAPRRLVVEEEDQWIEISIYDTVVGTVLNKAFMREGGGGFDPTGRYYYHGDNNISDASIHKFDVTGDQFFEMAKVRSSAASYYGSRTVIVSENGNRVFWNGSVFDANLVEVWPIGDEIYAASFDGRLAFGNSKIYDVNSRQAVLGMPVDTKVSAFNSTSRKLVVQAGNALAFYNITDPVSLPAPVLSLDSKDVNLISLVWTDQSLENSFTLQWRPSVSAEWVDVGSLGRNTVRYTLTGLTPNTAYDFRVKAEAGAISSVWSNVLTVTTLPRGAFTLSLGYAPGGASSAVTLGDSNPSQSGYALMDVQTGSVPYATAVITMRQNGVVVSEVGVPSSPPTIAARIFVEYRTNVPISQGSTGTIDVNTGMAMVNRGTISSSITYQLRNSDGAIIAVGHGTLDAQAHRSFFIHELSSYAPDFVLPPDFDRATGYGTLDILSEQPLSVLAMRMTTNQRKEILFTTTPVADISRTARAMPLYFPQFADGGGYRTTLYLMNTTSFVERGTVGFLGNGGEPLTVGIVGETQSPSSSFPYDIPPGGCKILVSEGLLPDTMAGWIKVTPAPGTATPEGGAVSGYAPAAILVTETGIPSTAPTTHARIYVDRTNRHEVGLALAAPDNTPVHITLQAFGRDGVTPAGSGTVDLVANGHDARFAYELIPSLLQGFTGVLDITAASPFTALTMRSLTNSRNEFLITMFPVADFNQLAPYPIVFPQIADGQGYQTEFILLSAGSSGSTTLSFFDNNGTALGIGKRQ